MRHVDATSIPHGFMRIAISQLAVPPGRHPEALVPGSWRRAPRHTMRIFFRCVATFTAAVMLGALGGCANSPATRLYVLVPLEGSGAAVETREGPAVGLRRVELPDYLDRVEIVTRAGPNTLQVAEFDRWAAPLRESFSQVLAENLRSLIPTDRVAVFPWPQTMPIEYEVEVTVLRFDGALGGECALVARWQIVAKGERATVAKGTSRHTASTGGDYESLVTAESRLVASLGRDIAAALRRGPGRVIDPVGGGLGTWSNTLPPVIR
jgi:uncharacterized protein